MTEKTFRIGIAVKDHALFVDIDTHDIPLNVIAHLSENWLVYRTRHGYHLLNTFFNDLTVMQEWMFLKNTYADPDCPLTSVRIYPSEDYHLILEPKKFYGYKLKYIYSLIFPELKDIEEVVYPNEPQLKYTFYFVEKTETGEEKKLNAEQNLAEMMSLEEKAKQFLKSKGVVIKE